MDAKLLKQAVLRGVVRVLWLPGVRVEEIDYSPEAQILRLGKTLDRHDADTPCV